MRLQFKEQQFQIDAVKAVVDYFAGQPIKTNHFTLEQSKDIIQLAQGVVANKLKLEAMESIGYRNTPIQITDHQILKNMALYRQLYNF